MFHENKQDIISSQNEQPEISNEPETTENPPEALYSQDDAQQLIEKGEVWRLAKELKNYQDLNENIAEQLLDKGYCREVLDNLDKFRDLEHSKILKCLIDDGHFEELIDYMDKLSNIPHQQIAQELINQGKIELLAQKLEKFSGLDENIAEQLIKENYSYEVRDCLGTAFSNLSLDFAQKLINEGHEQTIAYHIKGFSPEIHNDIAHLILENGSGFSVLYNWEKFAKIDFSDEEYETMANKIINSNNYGLIEELGKNIEKFPRSLHKKIAQQLIDSNNGQVVAKNLEKFSGLNHREIAQKLINIKWSRSLIYNIEKFSNINYNEIAHQLIDLKNKYDKTPFNRDQYDGTIYRLAEDLKKFSGLDKDIAIALIHAGGYHRLQVANNLQAFSPADHEAIILELINYPYSEEVKNALKNSFGKIPQSNKAVARQLAKSGYIEILAEYPEKFPELDSDLQKQIDNYKATHPNK